MDALLLFHDAGEAQQLGQLPGHANAFAASANKVRGWGDHI
jgi:hypothetical protein